MTQALGTRVIERYGGATSSFLVGLTNPMDSSATSIDSTVLGYAVNDVYAAFKIYGGVVYDESSTTNPDHYDEHIATGVQCVIAKLRAYTGQITGQEAWDLCVQLLTSMSKVGARDRFAMQVTGNLETSDPSGTVRPEFDSERFDGYVPDNNPGGNSALGPQVGS